MYFIEKIGKTIMLIIMSPMLRDDPKSTKETASKMFWSVLKDIWTNKIKEQSMRRDGRDVFFRQLNLDKSVMKVVSAFIEIKQEMLKEDTDAYTNGKEYKA